MQTLAVALLAVLGVALAGLLVAEARRSQRGIWIAKPVASAAFLALPFALGGPSGASGIAIVAGLGLSFLGDLALIRKDVRSFRASIALFLLAHLAYAVGFTLLGVSVPRALAALVLLTISGVLLTRWFYPGVPANLRSAVIGYVIVISLMVLLAFSAWGAGSSWLVPGVALAFYVSDITVARHKFVREQPLNRLLGLPLYYAAQVGFAFLASMC